MNNGVKVPFGGDINSSELLRVSKGLRTFTEGISGSESEIEQTRSFIYDCETLSFLGFAYHDLNLQLLFGDKREVLVRNSKKVFGTAMGLSESNKKDIAYELASLFGLDQERVTLRRELSAAQLLPEYSRALKVPSAA